MKSILFLILSLFSISSVAAVNFKPIVTIEQSVNFASGPGAVENTYMRSGDSAIGLKGSKSISDDLSASFKILYAIGSKGAKDELLLDMFGQVSSRRFGTAKIGSYKGFMATDSLRTIDMFEANIYSQAVTNFKRTRDGMNYLSPRFKNFQIGVGGALSDTDRSGNKINSDLFESTVNYKTDNLYLTVDYLDNRTTNTKTVYVGGRYLIKSFKIVLGYETIDDSVNDRVNTVAGGIDWKLGKTNLRLGFKDKDTVGITYQSEAAYHLDKRTILYANYRIFNQDTPNTDKNIVTTGIRLNF